MAIKLIRNNVEQITFEDIGLAASAYQKKSSVWNPVEIGDFMNISMGEILNGEKRLIINFEHNGANFYLVTNHEDEISVRKKYPFSVIIYPRHP